MKTLRTFFLRLRNLFRKGQLDRELHDELASHLELHIADNLRSGMAPEEARRHALLKLGGLEQTKESVRDQRSILWLENLLQDLRFAFRLFRKSPAFTAVAVFTLGLGIAANTATFSISNTFLRNPVSYPEVDRVVMVMNQAPAQVDGWTTVSAADFLDWREQSHSFEALGAYEWAHVNMTGAGEPVKLQGFRVTANFFDILRATPLLGRTFATGEDEAGREHEAILTSAFWRSQFAADPTIIGRTIRLDGTPTQIIGVMKDNVRFPLGSDLWIPLVFSPQDKVLRNQHDLFPIARLKPGISFPQAAAEMRTIQDRLRTSFPHAETGWNTYLMPLGQFVAGRGRDYTLFFLYAVAFVLLIACTNVTNLLLARSTARQSEFAIRVALGATRSRLIRQALVESVLLAMGGMLVGLILGSWWISLLRSSMPPEVVRFNPSWDQVRLDRGVFLYTFAAALAAGLVAGLLPAFFGSSSDPNEALKETGRGSGASVSRTRLRSAFVVIEIAISLVLLVGAGLMVKGVQTLLRLNIKSDPQSVQTFRVALPLSRYAAPQKRAAFYDDLIDQLNRSSGVSSSAASGQVPFSGTDENSFSLEGQPAQLGEYRSAAYNRITPSYFRLLHVPLVEGREFDDRDSADSAPVAIISESFAKRFWPDRSALGHRLKSGDEDSPAPWAIIVGVVGEVTYDGWRHDVVPCIYFPFRQQPLSNVYLAVRSTAEPKTLVPVIRAAVAKVDPDQPVYDVLPLDRLIYTRIWGLSFIAVLMGGTGFMALVLSAVGVSGVMAFSVAQRRHETGIRMALGARPQAVLRMFVFNGLKLLLLGMIIGLPLAFVLARLLSSLFFGVHPNDFVSFFGGALLLAFAVILACYIPARAATRVDPVIALRYE
ncbi:MAG: ADOP family duplicated permease [Candidatus Acidiferrales bacterium]